jgi:hypothetical protein
MGRSASSYLRSSSKTHEKDKDKPDPKEPKEIMAHIDISTKEIDFETLAQELTNAGVPHDGLGMYDGKLITYTKDGLWNFEWPTAAQVVVNKHVAPVPVDEVEEGLSVIGDMISGIDFGADSGSEELAGVMLAQNDIIKLMRQQRMGHGN